MLAAHAGAAPLAPLRGPRPALLVVLLLLGAAAAAAPPQGQADAAAQAPQQADAAGKASSTDGLALRGPRQLAGIDAALQGNGGGVPAVLRQRCRTTGLGQQQQTAADLTPVVGWLGTTCSLLLISSPALTFQKVAKQRSVGGLDPTPYLVGLLSCMLWCSYAALSSKAFIFGSNMCGGCLQLLWCCLFIRYSRRKKQLTATIIGIVALWFVLTALVYGVFKYLGFNPLHTSATLEVEAMGVICALLNVATYASPMGGAAQAIRTGSVENMPLPLSVMTLVASCFWFTYALLTRDPWCFVPNCCGVGLGAVQCLIYMRYSSKVSPAQSGLTTPETPDCAAARRHVASIHGVAAE